MSENKLVQSCFFSLNIFTTIIIEIITINGNISKPGVNTGIDSLVEVEGVETVLVVVGVV